MLPERIGMHDLQIQKKPSFNPITYSKKYREVHKDTIDKTRKLNYDKNKNHILATKIIWHLNQNLSTKPQQTSINKYGLVHNADTGFWSIKT